jgi:hypothetical protein
VHGGRRKARECATEAHLAGKCEEGGKCEKGRQPTTQRINLEEEIKKIKHNMRMTA